MAQTIKLKRSNVPGNVPTTGQLDIGEIALNMADALLFYRDPNGDIRQLTVSNVLKLDNTTEYTPTSDYNPSTKLYVDTAVLQSLVALYTIEKTQIINNEITLPKTALGDVILNMAMVYNDLITPVMTEYTCSISEDGTKVLFDPLDDLNNKYCVLTYLAFSNI